MQDHVVQEAKLISNLCYQIRDYAEHKHLNVDDTIKRVGNNPKDFPNLCIQIKNYAVHNHLNVDNTVQRIGDGIKDFSMMSTYDGKKGSFINRR